MVFWLSERERIIEFIKYQPRKKRHQGKTTITLKKKKNNINMKTLKQFEIFSPDIKKRTRTKKRQPSTKRHKHWNTTTT